MNINNIWSVRGFIPNVKFISLPVYSAFSDQGNGAPAVVVYQAQSDESIWVRPLSEFLEAVPYERDGKKLIPRFERTCRTYYGPVHHT